MKQLTSYKRSTDETDTGGLGYSDISITSNVYSESRKISAEAIAKALGA